MQIRQAKKFGAQNDERERQTRCKMRVWISSKNCCLPVCGCGTKPHNDYDKSTEAGLSGKLRRSGRGKANNTNKDKTLEF